MNTATQPADRRQADIERQARAWIRLIASGQATLREADALWHNLKKFDNFHGT